MFTDEFLKGLLSARHVVISTGAGMSAESGIPTFRDAQSGLWAKFDPLTLASPEGFLADPELVWGWYEWRRMQVMQAKPNPGHRAIAELGNRVRQLTMITQNVDDLHERAGSLDVMHLHGSLHRPRCFDCGRPYAFPPGIPDEPAGGRRLPPPLCGHCQGTIRPGVVWFGEELCDADWRQAEQAAMFCDMFFSIGTSAMVWPAAWLPDKAAKQGAKVIQINPTATLLDSHAHYNFRGKSGEILPAMLLALSGFSDSASKSH